MSGGAGFLPSTVLPEHLEGRVVEAEIPKRHDLGQMQVARFLNGGGVDDGGDADGDT